MPSCYPCNCLAYHLKRPLLQTKAIDKASAPMSRGWWSNFSRRTPACFLPSQAADANAAEGQFRLTHADRAQASKQIKCCCKSRLTLGLGPRMATIDACVVAIDTLRRQPFVEVCRVEGIRNCSDRISATPLL